MPNEDRHSRSIAQSEMSGKARAVDEEAPLISNAQAGPTFSSRLYEYDPFSPELLAYADARARTRTIKAVILGFLIYILLGLVTGVGVFKGAHTRWRKGRFQLGGSWPGRPDPLPSDGKALQCGAFVADPEPVWDWLGSSSTLRTASSDPHIGNNSTKVWFDVDLDEGAGFFISAHGSLARGTLDFRIEEAANRNESHLGARTVEVEVGVRYNDERLLALANICTMRRKGAHGEVASGLGLYTPTSDLPAAASHIDFTVIVRIPPSLTDIVSLDALSAELDIIGSLEQLYVPTIKLVGQDARIAVDKLNGRDIHLSTINGLIHGVYNVSKSLDVKSDNGRIEAEVGLYPLQGDAIEVDASSNNGAVHLNYIHHDLGVELHSHAQTTNGATLVKMLPAFEGTFDIRTTWGGATQNGPEQSSDPTGGNRLLHISESEHTIGSSHVAGTITWAKRQVKKLGSSSVSTTTGAALLSFQ